MKVSLKNYSLKALKGVPKVASFAAFKLAIPLGIEYLFCYAVSAVVSDSLLHGQLDQPVAALGLLAIGTFYRYFNAPRPGAQDQVVMMPAQAPAALVEALLSQAAAEADRDPAAAGHAAQAGPYL